MRITPNPYKDQRCVDCHQSLDYFVAFGRIEDDSELPDDQVVLICPQCLVQAQQIVDRHRNYLGEEP